MQRRSWVVIWKQECRQGIAPYQSRKRLKTWHWWIHLSLVFSSLYYSSLLLENYRSSRWIKIIGFVKGIVECSCRKGPVKRFCEKSLKRKQRGKDDYGHFGTFTYIIYIKAHRWKSEPIVMGFLLHLPSETIAWSFFWVGDWEPC